MKEDVKIGITEKDLKSIYRLLCEIEAPMVVLTDDLKGMMKNALDSQKDRAELAKEILQSYDVEEL